MQRQCKTQAFSSVQLVLCDRGYNSLNHGRWRDRQLVSEKWLKDAVTPSAHGPDYGYLWWLNTRKQQWPSGPSTSFAAIGNGANTIWIDPEHDIVFVWHWHQGQAMDGMIQRIVAAVSGS